MGTGHLRSAAAAPLLALCVLAMVGGTAPGGVVYDAVTDYSETVNTDTSDWSYRYSDDLVRDGAYATMPYSVTAGVWIPPYQNWRAVRPTGGSEYAHAMGANRSGSPLIFNSTFPFVWPDNTIWMHPDGYENGIPGLTVLSWLAPTSGVVAITYSFTDMDPHGGDGVDWFIDLGDGTGNLASGTVWSSGTPTTGVQTIPGVPVNAGDRVNFIVSPGASGSHVFDSTQVTALISLDSLDVIPEPATMALLGLGLAAIARRRRRK